MPADLADNRARMIRHSGAGRQAASRHAGTAIDDAVGTLSPVGWEPTQGKTPRFFAIEPSGAVLYAANTDWWRSASTRAVANSRRPARSS